MFRQNILIVDHPRSSLRIHLDCLITHISRAWHLDYILIPVAGVSTAGIVVTIPCTTSVGKWTLFKCVVISCSLPALFSIMRSWQRTCTESAKARLSKGADYSSCMCLNSKCFSTMLFPCSIKPLVFIHTFPSHSFTTLWIVLLTNSQPLSEWSILGTPM